MDGYTGTLSCDNIPIDGRCNCTRVGEITIVDGGDSGAERDLDDGGAAGVRGERPVAGGRR